MACRSSPQEGGRLLGKTLSPRSKVLEGFIESGGIFKRVKAGSLFRVKSNPQLDKENFKFSPTSTYPYFTRTVFNNGLLGYVDYLDDEHLISGNSIAVGMMGMKFFYQSHDFYAGQFTKTIFPKFKGFNEKIALWFIAWFNKHSSVLSGGLVRDFERLFNSVEIEVPYIGKEIALSYIESRIRELEESRIRELEAYLNEVGFENCDLSKDEIDALKMCQHKNIQLASFTIGELYDKVKLLKRNFDKRRDTSTNQSDDFPIPLVNAKSGNNGIMFYGKNDVFETEKMTLDIIQNGAIATGLVYAQPDNVGVLWDAFLIKAKGHQDTENTLLYMACAIQKSIRLKFDRDTKATWDRVKTQIIKLPVDNSDNIDVMFMENLISAIKKSIVSNLKSFIQKEHNAYLDVVK